MILSKVLCFVKYGEDMINIELKANCCGCGACMASCPTNSITMKKDYEGFLYPFVNMDTCIKCKKCILDCPIQNTITGKEYERKAYLAQNLEESIRLQSTSGGVFSALASAVIRQGGVVIGAAFDEAFNVKHISVDNINELSKFRNSKYVQSDCSYSYNVTKKSLEEGKIVLFSGTPCQIMGLKKFVKKDYRTLFCIDVVCRAVPSPLILQKYIEWHEKKTKDKVKSIRFRDKKLYGYRYTQMEVEYVNRPKKYYGGREFDPYLRAFFEGYCNRPSCEACKFKYVEHVSDITIWDAQDCGALDNKFDDNKGTNKVLIHSVQGEELWTRSKNLLKFTEISVEDAIYRVKELTEPTKTHRKRNQFMKAAISMSGDALFEQYFPITLTTKIKRMCKILLSKLEMYDYVKRIVKR